MYMTNESALRLVRDQSICLFPSIPIRIQLLVAFFFWLHSTYVTNLNDRTIRSPLSFLFPTQKQTFFFNFSNTDR